MLNEDEIRVELSKLLEFDPYNYSRILELSSKLATFDKENIRFTVDAGVINRLGKELVARHETALAELAKNSYDADATTVDIYFEDANSAGGRLIIEDNGHGMNREKLIDGFMRISSSDKIHNPKSPLYKRIRAGKKGIGRFATQRLGDLLTIITQTKSDEHAYKLTVDWSTYEIDKEITSIENKIRKINKEKEEGSILIIEGLRDNWTETMMKRAYRYLSDLLQPFPLSEKNVIDKSDPGFKVNIFKKIGTQFVPVVDENEVYFKHATAEIEGYVDHEGYGYYSVRSTKFELDDEVKIIGIDNIVNPYAKLRNVHIRAYYYLYNFGLIPKQIETMIRETAQEFGGIRLYRNGFRVLPFGERDNDWLYLDRSVRRRTILPPHGNINFFGFVELFDNNPEDFEELSSREGLVETTAVKELQDFGYKVLTDAVMKIAAVRGKKQTAGQKNWERKPKEIIDEIAGEIEAAAKSKNSSNDKGPDFDSEKFEDYAKRLKEASSEQSRIENLLIEEINLLRVLASLGLIIGEFIHEIKHYPNSLWIDVDFLMRSLKENSSALEKGKRLKENINALTTYTSYFDKTISQNVNRELKPLEIRDVVNTFIDVIKPDLERNGISNIKPEFNGYDLFTCPMHNSEWASILFNLYSNSKKAIKRTNSSAKIFIKAGKENNIIYLEFSDTGDGIPDKDKDRIFDAFFTTSQPTGSLIPEYEELTGTGLGLKIVKDIVNGYDGDVFVKIPTEGFSTTIRIELPKSEIEI